MAPDPGSERDVATCATATEPYPEGPYPVDDESYDRHPRYACSTGGATGGLPILLGAFAALGLRRRRRC
jgi:MYXO-CTERM domain-containing protein